MLTHLAKIKCQNFTNQQVIFGRLGVCMNFWSESVVYFQGMFRLKIFLPYGPVLTKIKKKKKKIKI